MMEEREAGRGGKGPLKSVIFPGVVKGEERAAVVSLKFLLSRNVH